MKIDAKVEPLVREALNAIVKTDTERFARALDAFPTPEAEAAGYQLAAAVAFLVLHEQFGGQPSLAQIGELAQDVAEAENWTDITAAEVRRYITGYYAGTTADKVMSPIRAVLVSYVLAANLLASYHLDGEWWFDYLDRVELALEAG